MPDPDDCPDELDAAQHKVEQLERALDSSRHIGAAIGILMTSHRCTEQAAFELIRAHSQTTQIKVGVLAERLIETGDTTGYGQMAVGRGAQPDPPTIRGS